MLRILKGDIEGDFDKARGTTHNTPASKRSEFAKEIWRRRMCWVWLYRSRTGVHHCASRKPSERERQNISRRIYWALQTVSD